MKVKTSALTGVALDWAVAKCEVGAEFIGEINDPHFYSTDWALAGPIVEREKIDLNYFPDGSYDNGGAWMATRTDGPAVSEEEGDTPLAAAMRCYVASKLGDEVELPEELTQ